MALRTKIPPQGGTTNGGTTTTDQRYFVYDGDQMVLVMDAGGAVQNRYLWGAAVDEILADEQVGGEPLWTLTDNLGTVRELVNNTSTVRNHIVYDTYGNVLSETAGGARSAIKFTGRYFDTETGLQWNLNRWYDAKTGRWLSQDPIGFEGGDGNLYRYVGNDPGNGVDPSGLAENAQAALEEIREKRDELKAAASEKIFDVLRNHYKPPTRLGRATDEQLRHAANLIAQQYISAVEDFLKTHPGARPRLGHRIGGDAERAPWCADWAVGIDGAMRLHPDRSREVPIGKGTQRVSEIFKVSYAQGHGENPILNVLRIRGSLQRHVLGYMWYQHNYVIGYPAGYEDLPKYADTINDCWDLLEVTPSTGPGILVLDPWIGPVRNIVSASRNR